MNNTKFDFFEAVVNNMNFEVLEHGHLKGDSNWKYYHVNSPFNRLYFIMDGKGHLENECGNIPLQKGNAYLIPLHTTCNYICDDYIEKFYIHFRTELFSGYDLFESLDECSICRVDESVLHELLMRIRSRNVHDIIYCKALFLEVIAGFASDIAERFDIELQNAIRYRKVYEYVKGHCHAGIAIRELADCMQVSASSLIKNFKLDTGETLKNYIDKKIMQKAKEKFLLSDMTVKEVAYSLKFCDQFYFSRFFKKHTGMSPRQYKAFNEMI